MPQALLRVALLALVGGATALPANVLLLSDEFASNTAASFQRVETVEGWPNNPLEVFNVNTTRPGWLTMMPRTVTWYEDYRGPLVFKEATGDFAVTTFVEVTNRAGTGAPNRLFSLAGIMVRAPRAITPATWTAGGEKYSFLSIGSANNPGTFQYEVKSTSNEDELPEYSRLDISATDCACGSSIIQTVRLGQYVIQIAKTPTGPWRVVNRYRRPDLPATLQVGFVTYTDWENVQLYPVGVHNTTTITTRYNQPAVASQPDLVAYFDYMRFAVPTLPSALVGVDLANPALVSDAQLLAFLGESLAEPPSTGIADSFVLF